VGSGCYNWLQAFSRGWGPFESRPYVPPACCRCHGWVQAVANICRIPSCPTLSRAAPQLWQAQHRQWAAMVGTHTYMSEVWLQPGSLWDLCAVGAMAGVLAVMRSRTTRRRPRPPPHPAPSAVAGAAQAGEAAVGAHTCVSEMWLQPRALWTCVLWVPGLGCWL
jgi:hypothetical protein